MSSTVDDYKPHLQGKNVFETEELLKQKEELLKQNKWELCKIYVYCVLFCVFGMVLAANLGVILAILILVILLTLICRIKGYRSRSVTVK